MNNTPQWSRSLKQLVSATLLILALLLLYSFRTILIPLVLVFLFSYIFAPVIGWVSNLLGIGRGWAVIMLYLIGLGALITLPAVTIPVIVDEVGSLIRNLDDILQRLFAWLQQWDQYEFEFMGYVFVLPEIETLLSSFSFDLDRVYAILEGTLSPVAGGAVSVVRVIASGIGWLTVLAVMAYYMLVDADRLVPAVLNLVPPEYRDEGARLARQINRTWNAFLRGQLVLCGVIGIMTAVAMGAVGIRFALALGIVAGILEVIPNLGPVLSSVPAILLALFQGSSFLPISKVGMAVLVALIYWIIQNLENSLLVPRIMGSTLNLHPLIIIVGVLGGATLGGTLGALGGILGIFLAAPILATLRHVLRYVYHKLADLDPFPPPQPFSVMAKERKIKAILFDLDGTLLDSDDMLVARWGQRLDRLPVLKRLCDGRWLARRLVMATESPMNATITLLDLLHLDQTLFAVTEWIRQLHGQRRPAEYEAVDGAVQLVQDLATQYDLAIITTRNRSDTELFLECFDLCDCFKTIVTRQDVKRLKPHPEPVRLAAERLGYAPEQCIMVGDTIVDLQAGQRAGALTVGVLCGFGERPEMEQQSPDLLLETTAQLKQRLPGGGATWYGSW
jgi:HAD superfamily hydrolase (TIGR01509 family)